MSEPVIAAGLRAFVAVGDCAFEPLKSAITAASSRSICGWRSSCACRSVSRWLATRLSRKASVGMSRR